MFKAIVFKEWLKIRWAYAVAVIICLLMLGNIILNLNHDIKFNSPIAMWNAVVFLGHQYYEGLRYIPLFVGLMVAAAQFIPEMVTSRLKLSLHLPVRENSIVLQMLAVGLLAVAALLLVTIVLLSAISLFYFPSQILRSALLTTAPWFLAGLVGYLGLSAVIIEPRWVRRVFLLIISYGVIDSLLLAVNYETFILLLPSATVVAACFTLAIVFTGYRFRRGVR
jgi:hypothetical protein